MKKVLALTMALIIAVSLGSNPVVALQGQNTQVGKPPLTDRQVRINANVADISNRHLQRIGEMRLAAEVNNVTLDEQAAELNAQRTLKECLAEIKAYLKSEGLVECGKYDGESFVFGEESTSSVVSPMSMSSELTVYPDAVMDVDGSIYYYAYWDWTPQYNYDVFWDTYDLVSAQLESDNGWRWKSMECQTWDQNGNETGFTDGTAGNTRGDSVTLRDDFWQGKIYNLHDEWNPLMYRYKTDMVRIAGWINKGSTATNRVKTNFEHNWKTVTPSASASISSAQFVGFGLSVTYNTVHHNWLRGSNALTIPK